MMGLRGDYFHTVRDLYLAKRLLNQLKLTTGKSLWPQKNHAAAMSVQCMQLSAHNFSRTGFG